MDPDAVPRLPRLRRPPLPRVLGGVLRRCLPRAARRLVGDQPRVASPTFRNWDLPQRRQIFAGRAPRPGRVMARARRHRERLMEPLTPPEPAEAAIRIDSHLDGAQERSLAEDVLDGLTRPFKELPPKHFYDARGAELFDRICELPEYYPTRAERAILEETRRGAGGAHRRGRARRAGLGHGGQDARAAGRAARGGHAGALRPRGRHREHGARLRRRS